MNKKDRFKKAYDFLRYSGELHTQKELAERMGTTPPNVSSALKGIDSVLTDNFLKRFNEAFNKKFQLDWLISGDGEMLNVTGETQTAIPNSQINSMPETSVIRYWNDCDVTAGGVESFDDWNKDFIPISLPDFGDCTDAVNVRGDSMHPVYKNGNIVILKEWKENFIEYGSAYLIVTKNGNRMIKYIKPGADKEHISCVSENEFYEPFEVERADILRLYKVKGCVAKTEL